MRRSMRGRNWEDKNQIKDGLETYTGNRQIQLIYQVCVYVCGGSGG